MVVRARAFIGTVRGRWTVRSAVVAAVLWLIDQVTGNWVTGTVLPTVWDWINQIAKAPPGLLGAIAFLLFVIAMISSVIASVRASRRPEPEIALARVEHQLSAEEKGEIERVREMWVGESARACETLKLLLEGLTTHFANAGDPFAYLVGTGPQNDLSSAMKSFERSLAPDSKERLRTVQENLTSLVGHYWHGVALLNRSFKADPGWLTDPNTIANESRFASWVRDHQHFAKSLDLLGKRSLFRGKGFYVAPDYERMLFDTDQWGDFRPLASRPRLTPESTPPISITANEDGTAPEAPPAEK